MNDEVIEHAVDPLPFDAELERLLDELRGTYRFQVISVPWSGGVDAGLARHYRQVYLQLVLPLHSVSTVHRTEVVDDRNAPSHLLHKAEELFSGSRTEAAQYLLDLVNTHLTQDTAPTGQVG
ncbi:hypothetical protein [Actinosynnema sp. NPDC023587]|uniref:hypothetical protein n=1 Tax=Actinosynnema sp. NPDC023587 TaxID=3154695 RepID=UPI0033E7B05D